MIEISVFKRNNDTKRITSKGHAYYADKGKDIVCAAVSVLLINTVNSIELYTDDIMEVKEDDGMLDIRFPNSLSHDAGLLVSALILGLKEIAKEYGSDFITLNFQEV